MSFEDTCKREVKGTAEEVEELFENGNSDDIEEYFENILDIEYRINEQKQYKSVQLMCTCGGPNIYIDTADKLAKLYWGETYMEYPISYAVCDKIDDYVQDVYFND